MSQPRGARILLLDLETSPYIALSWGKYDQNIPAFLQESKIIAFGWKWLHEKETYVLGLPDMKGYKPGIFNVDDKPLVKKLAEIMDKADLVIAHNGDSFDIKVVNTRMLVHGLEPNHPLTSIDTKLVSKGHFRFPSNKLDDIARTMGIGRKRPHTGIDMWIDCLAGDMAAWKMMKLYNKQDVVLLEQAYLKMRPWMKTHPNMNVYQDTKLCCRACGGEDLQMRGFSYTPTGKRQRYQCRKCYHYSVGPVIPLKPIVR
jgi:hypothetical protein